MKSSSGSSLQLSLGVLGVICVGLAVTTVWAVRSSRLAQAQLGEREAELAQLKAVPTGKSSTPKEELLRKVLAEKEDAYSKLLADYRALQGTDTRTEVAAADASARTNATASARGSWMERLKTEDPERYKQIQEDREKRRQYMEGQVRDQLARLDQRLQNAHSQEEVNLISQISDTIGQLDGLRQQWQDIRELPDDQRRQKFEELATTTRDAYRTLTTLRAQDRQMQLQQLATQVGYNNPADQAQFSAAIQQIYQETDTSMERMMGFGHSHGGGGGRGGSTSGQ